MTSVLDAVAFAMLIMLTRSQLGLAGAPPTVHAVGTANSRAIECARGRAQRRKTARSAN